jgi:hypothetical protein
MLPAWRVAEIRRMLARGELSQRKIAEQTGVSRGTVGAIALGRRPDYEDRRQAARGDFEPPSGPLHRCPGCGGMVLMPCLLCRVRALRDGGGSTPGLFPVRFDRREGVDRS